jgi:5'-3' exoribonuclease 2
VPMPFAYDGERAVDDFVMLTILCGNDFVPHLPSLDIGEGALDTMLQLYRYGYWYPHSVASPLWCNSRAGVSCRVSRRDRLPSLGGYLVENSSIDLDRLEVFTTHMGSLERDIFAEREKEARRFARRQRGR